MARTRTGSTEPGRRVRDISSQPPPEATRIIRSPRDRSASPGPNSMVQGTRYRRNQPTPVRPPTVAVQHQQHQQVRNNKVVKNTGKRTQGKRAKSVDSEGRTSRENSVASSSGRGNVWGGVGEIEQIRQILPLVPEGSEEEVPVPDASRYIPSPRARQRPDSEFSLSTYSSPEPDVSGTQLEVDDMDVDLMFETFPDLDSYAKKLLDLLILDPPENLLQNLRKPGSKSSKRLRLYEQNFTASKSAYGTSKYLSAHYVEVALNGNSSFDPLIHKSNLAILATFAYTAQEFGDGTFEELKEIEREFPSQFGDVLHEMNFQVALDLRTQTLVMGLMKNQDVKDFNPDSYLRHFFMESFDNEPKHRVKPWVEMKDIKGWEDQVLKRIKQIETAFEDKDDDKLASLFPWHEFVERISGYVKARLTEIERSREGKSIQDLINDAKNPPSLEMVKKVFLDESAQSKAQESVQEQPTTTTPENDVDVFYPKLSEIGAKNQVETETEAEVEAAALQESARVDIGSLNIESCKQLKKRQEKLDRERLESPALIYNIAQIRDLKRRKTAPVPQKVPEVQSAQRMATSLGSQEAVGISLAQVKFLKDRKLGMELPERQVEENEDVAVPGSPRNPPVCASEWFRALTKNRKIKDKENDKSVASIILPQSPPQGIKRKRFIDPQEGATRVSQIEEDMPESPAKRQQVHKGKGKVLPWAKYEEVVVVEAVEEEEEEEAEEEVRPNYADDGEDGEEDEDLFQQDNRKENEEKLKKSRRNLPRTHSTSSSLPAPTRVSSSLMRSREQLIARPEGHQRQITHSRDSRGSKSSRIELAGNARITYGDRHEEVDYDTYGEEEEDEDYREEYEEYEEEEEEEEEEEGEEGLRVEGGVENVDRNSEDIDDEDEDEDEYDINQRRTALVSRVNRLAKMSHVRKPRAPALPKTREPWGIAQTELLVKMVGRWGCQWAKIRDLKLRAFSGRTNVQLKDKARNIKYDYLRARIPLPHNFDQVTISKKQVDALRDMGIDCDD